MTRTRQLWIALWLGSAALVAVIAAQTYLGAGYAGAATSPWRALAVAAAAIVPWTLLTPAIFALARRWPLGSGSTWRRPALHLFAALATTALKVGVEGRIDAWVYGAAVEVVSLNLYLNFVVYWLIAFGAHWGLAQTRLRERSQRAAELEGLLARARLQALEDRLRPHFLFNSLNAVSSLMHDDVDAADEAIERLGSLLRRALDQDQNATVSLHDEIEFGRRYLELEGLRWGDRLSTSWHVDARVEGCQVPSFLLQPLLENAVQHGVAPRAAGGRIEVRAECGDGLLRLTVSDDGVGFASDHAEGIGLGTTRARLAGLYGDAARLRVESIASGGTRVCVEIPQ